MNYERNKKPIIYKVKFYHDTKNEKFYCNVYPKSLIDRIRIMFYKE